jgi:hypothetical protein
MTHTRYAFVKANWQVDAVRPHLDGLQRLIASERASHLCGEFETIIAACKPIRWCLAQGCV